jgi:hypothetical protein
MEERGGDNFENAEKRMRVWARRGKKAFEDLVGYHYAINETKYFQSPKPKIQPTWRGLIHIALAARGKRVTTERIRTCQQRRWGRSGGDVCLAELFPLPSPNAQTWHYAEWTTLSELRSRDSYYREWGPRRVQALQEKIKKHQPKAVVFYGSSHDKYWKNIAVTRGEVAPRSDRRIRLLRSGPPTTFIAIPHTTSFGLGGAYFDEVGSFVRKAFDLSPNNAWYRAVAAAIMRCFRR